MSPRILNTQQLGQAIRHRRKQLGWTQADLARRSGLLGKTISAMENRPGSCQISTLLRLLSAMDFQIGLQAKSEAPPSNQADW